MLLLATFAFLSGIVTILSPCILPVLPIVLSGSVGGKRRPIGIISGFIASFSVFTLTLAAIVQLLNIPSDALRIVAVILIVSFGAVLLIPRLTVLFEVAVSRISGGQQKNKTTSGFTGGVITGLSLGLIWTPCVGPIMASVISLAITQTIDGGAVLIALAYALGTSIPMFAIMIGGRGLINKFPALMKNTGKIQRVFGVLLIFTGLSVGFGWDRDFQTAVLDIFPSYGEGVTFFENTDLVKDALDRRSGSDAELEIMSPAPEIITMGQWFNSEPLTMEELKGKVVIIDFWTYSCINCVRTIPYLQAWHETYSDDGLVIIGIHTPEFAFERNPDNVQEAIEDLGVSWPVVQDNRFLQWQAYNNRYWPAKYFVDREGNIRYSHFGEGDYEHSEEVIRELLAEDGSDAGAMALVPDEEKNESSTPETYLGHGRTENFISPEGISENDYADYSRAGDIRSGQWSLNGRWAFTKEYIVNEGMGSLELAFQAKDVFLVVEPVDENAELIIEVDGSPSSDTVDVLEGRLRVKESRHYHLVGLEEAGSHKLKIRAEGKVRLFAFTFG